MGDMGDLFNEMKRLTRERRKANLASAYEIGADGWTVHCKTHWSRTIKGQRLDYWPSTNKWRFMGRNHNGDRESLNGFIRNRETHCVP